MKKILIVDDDHVICEMLKYLLEHKGYEVCIAREFTDLCSKEEHCNSDIILLDKRLGTVDGTLVCMKLKDGKCSRIPIIMMSALDKARKACIMAGADDFISKPFEIKNMFSKIERLLDIYI